MLLYHFSNYDFKLINPSFFGKNSYSKNEREACHIKRSFFYDCINPLEYSLKDSNFRYTVNVKDNLIYDLDKDKFGLKDKFNFNIDLILVYCKKHFQGITYNTSFKTYCLFKTIKPIKKEGLKNYV